MSWFQEQIQNRKDHDRKIIDEAYEGAINSILGEHFSFDDAEEAITLILKYYHLSLKQIPNIEDENDRFLAVCRLVGLMHRPIKLEGKWYKDAFGAFLAKKKDGGEYVALLQDALGNYYYYDSKLKKRIKINNKTKDNLEIDAICFSKPLQNKKLTTRDLIKFAISTWSPFDHAVTYLLLGIATLVGLLSPKLSYFLYQYVVSEKSISLLLSTMIFIVTVNISLVFLQTIRTLFSSRTTVKMTLAIREATMMRMLSLPARFFRKYSSGEILQRVGYVQSICSTIINMLFSTTVTSLFSLVYITQIFNYAPSLVIPSLIIILINVVFSIVTTFIQMKISKKQMEISAKNSGVTIAMVSGIQKIKLAGAEKRMFARWLNYLADETRILYNPPLFIKINSVIALIITLVGQWIMYFLSIKSGVDYASYYAFIIAYGMVYSAISTLVNAAVGIASLRPSLEMVKPFLEELPEDENNTQQILDFSGNIEMNNVTFQYEENSPLILDHFSLKINAGEYIAIVGKTGCGKSTLVRLLLGFEKPNMGAIYYDGKDLKQIEKKSFRQKIGTVMQDDRLFNGDIYSNIVICAPHLKLDDAWKAAEIAGIADDIKAMPMGMNTIISEGQGGISGGQRQRLVIARAIAPKPKILIFDEATSALDNITQKEISDALDNLNCTRIVIAHRLSTIRHCDRILVMDKGKIIEEGSYEALCKQNGYFASLVARQRLDNED